MAVESRDRRARKRRRRGGLYVVVLGVALIVSVLALGAIAVGRIQRRMSVAAADTAEARLYAMAAIEMGRLRIKNDLDWRNTYASGVWEANVPVGDGAYTLEGIDEDGLLNDSLTDALVLAGTGRRAAARQKLQVTLVPEFPPLSCLEVPLQAGNDVLLNYTHIQSDRAISANNAIIADLNTTGTSDLEAVGSITAGGIAGQQTTGITPRALPDEATVFDYYLNNGTPVPVASLPTSGDNVYYLENVFLSPASNPYGPVNPEGIYVIDCQGKELNVNNCRVVGTLVILDGDPNTGMHGSVSLQPAVANYPALLARGPMRICTTAEPLDEAALGADLNGDADTLDAYPSLLKGLIYVSTDLDAPLASTVISLEGVLVVGNTLTISPSTPATTELSLTYGSTHHDNPPPGFHHPPKMVVSPGSWKRVVD